MPLIECGSKISRGVDPSTAISYEQAMGLYRRRHPKITTQLVSVEGLDSSLTSYNCTPMVDDNQKPHLLGRVEPIDTEVSQAGGFDFTSCRTYPDGFVEQNGLVIPGAQDPSISLISPNKTAIGVVAITEALAKGQVANYWPQLYEFEGGHVSQEKHAIGPEAQKDIRVAYVGSYGGQDLSVIAARVRHDDGNKIQSYLQVGIVPTAEDIQLLSRDITQVRNDPTSRLDVLIPDNRTWFGPNQIIPLQSQEGNLAFGLLFHTGRLTNRLYENGERGRVYKVFVTEISADPETRQVTCFTRPQVIATAADFPYTEAKRPDLWNVLFPGGFMFGIRRGLVEKSTLACGLRDRYNGLVRTDYPFSRPLNVELNRLFIIPVEKMPNLL